MVLLAAFVVGAIVLAVSFGRSNHVRTDANLSVEDFACPRCNVIFLNLELLRADHAGLIANTPYTPEIDRFFANALIFHDVTAPGGETFLSNTAVQTGVPPHLIDISGMDIDSLARSKSRTEKYTRIEAALTRFDSWSQVLGRHGYRTIGMNQGGRAGEGVFLDRGVDDYTQWPKDALFDDVASHLERVLSDGPERPFYLLFRPTVLHNQQYRLPYVPDWLERLSIRINDYIYQSREGTWYQAYHLKRNVDVSEAAQRRMERLIYRAQLEYADSRFAGIFDLLREKYVEDSIIVLYANHGSGLGDNGAFDHGTAYQASVHVPLFIRHPRIDTPVHVKTPVSLFDLVPTVSRWIGVEGADWSMIEPYDRTIVRGGADGVPEIVGKNSWDEYIRRGEWKYIVRYSSQRLLYNIVEDPGETRNRYDDNPAKAAELEARLAAYKRRLHEQARVNE